MNYGKPLRNLIVMGDNMRNSSFKFTVDCSDAADMLKLEAFRKSIREYNKVYPNERMRIRARGRGPRKSAALADCLSNNGYLRYNRDLPLRHAKRIDVYLY